MAKKPMCLKMTTKMNEEKVRKHLSIAIPVVRKTKV